LEYHINKRNISTTMTKGSESSKSLEEMEKLVAFKAVDDFVTSGMIVGLGTGSTALHAVERIGRKLKSGELKDIQCVPTSEETTLLAEKLKIPLITLSDLNDSQQQIDVTIDGADDVDEKHLFLIKGGGGALLHEKMVESFSKKFVCVIDESKVSEYLGPKFALPVEITPFSFDHTIRMIESLSSLKGTGCKGVIRMGSLGTNKKDGKKIAVTENGNYIVDLHFTGSLSDVRSIARELSDVVGVVEHGLFVDLASIVLVGCKNGEIRELHKHSRPVELLLDTSSSFTSAFSDVGSSFNALKSVFAQESEGTVDFWGNNVSEKITDSGSSPFNASKSLQALKSFFAQESEGKIDFWGNDVSEGTVEVQEGKEVHEKTVPNALKKLSPKSVTMKLRQRGGKSKKDDAEEKEGEEEEEEVYLGEHHMESSKSTSMKKGNKSVVVEEEEESEKENENHPSGHNKTKKRKSASGSSFSPREKINSLAKKFKHVNNDMFDMLESHGIM